MKSRVLAVALVVGAALPGSSLGSTNAFKGSIVPISPALARQMKGVS